MPAGRRIGRRQWLLGPAALALAGCATAPVDVPRASALADARHREALDALLADGAFAPPREAVGIADLFTLSAEMRHVVEVELAPAMRTLGRPRALLQALYRSDDGRSGLRIGYEALHTRPAAETFAARRGNCLSLVIMTAAFAKALDLPVDYRAAEIDATLSQRGHLILASGHVNITLGRRLLDHGSAGDARAYTVDFLPPDEAQRLPTRRLDETALVAMYLNNRAAEALADDRLDDAYAWARAALRHGGAEAMSANTLGVVLQRRGLLDQAERAYRHALARAPAQVSAQANLDGLRAPVVR